MNIGDAIKSLKEGKFITRLEWNDKSRFIYLVPTTKFNPVNLGECIYLDHIDIQVNKNTFMMWTPLHCDLLANDWIIVI